jgi:hypothetical protein
MMLEFNEEGRVIKAEVIGAPVRKDGSLGKPATPERPVDWPKRHGGKE